MSTTILYDTRGPDRAGYFGAGVPALELVTAGLVLGQALTVLHRLPTAR